MNRDYAYCVGPNYFGGPALCENCKRHIPFNTEVKETLVWTMTQYDVKTGTCPLHEPKTENVDWDADDIMDKIEEEL